MITLITPTSGRPLAFKMCEKLMARQTYSGDIQWIVVDDGVPPVECTLGQEYVRRGPSIKPLSSFRDNYLAAIDLVKHDKVLFIEDDDWYSPDYIEFMSGLLDDFSIVGEAGAKYYNIYNLGYRQLTNVVHCSLCQTGIRFEKFGELFRYNVSTHATMKQDTLLWKFSHESGANLKVFPSSIRSVGIKGFPGKGGLGVGHRSSYFQVDESGSVLRNWVGGDDASQYLKIFEDARLAGLVSREIRSRTKVSTVRLNKKVKKFRRRQK